jgi:hypothetical protein
MEYRLIATRERLVPSHLHNVNHRLSFSQIFLLLSPPFCSAVLTSPRGYMQPVKCCINMQLGCQLISELSVHLSRHYQHEHGAYIRAL